METEKYQWNAIILPTFGDGEINENEYIAEYNIRYGTKTQKQEDMQKSKK